MGKNFFKAILFVGLIYSSNSYTQPTITTLSPGYGRIANSVTISGTNFSNTPANNSVYFGGVKANVTAATTTSLTATIPVGTSYNPITVTNSSGTAYSNSPFRLTFPTGGVIDATTFAAKIDSANGLSPSFVTNVDLDGDGKLDVCVANLNTSNISIFRNISISGTISVEAQKKVATTGGVGSVAYGDIDGDGMQDIILTNYGNSANSVSILRNTSTLGNISFAAKVDYPLGVNPLGVLVRDLDLDGKADIIATNYTPPSSITLFRNISTIGSVNFEAGISYAAAGYPVGISCGDLNNDGKPEIAITNPLNNNISIYRNASVSGTLAFAAPVNFTAGIGPHDVEIGDLDMDGKPDLAVTNYGTNTTPNTTISILRNIAADGVAFTGASFDTHIQYTAGSRPRTLSISDINGDGKPDIVVANVNSSVISIFRNQSISGTIALLAKVDYTVGSGPYNVDISDLDGDGLPDITCSSNFSNSVSFLRNKIIILPIKLLSFTAIPKSNLIELNWELSTTGNIDNIVLEYSINTENWQPLSVQVQPTAVSLFIHKNPAGGKNYYRLKQTNKDGKIVYSEVRVVDLSKNTPIVNVYPNPVKNSYFTVDLGIEPSKNILYTITSLSGKIYKKGWLGSRQTTIHLPINAKGTYYLKIEGKKVIPVVVFN